MPSRGLHRPPRKGLFPSGMLPLNIPALTGSQWDLPNQNVWTPKHHWHHLLICAAECVAYQSKVISIYYNSGSEEEKEGRNWLRFGILIWRTHLVSGKNHDSGPGLENTARGGLWDEGFLWLLEHKLPMFPGEEWIDLSRSPRNEQSNHCRSKRFMRKINYANESKGIA